MPYRLKSHIILVLDRLQCVARVNCLVQVKRRTRLFVAINLHISVLSIYYAVFERSPLYEPFIIGDYLVYFQVATHCAIVISYKLPDYKADYEAGGGSR